MLILVLAANTAYADFPRLASIVARDRFLPRQFMNQGDRLAFSNGILILSVLAAVLLVGFRRRHARADPALHDRRLRLVHAVAGGHGRPLAQARASRAGARARSSTASARSSPAIVLVIVAVTKAAEGAWIIILLIPVLVVLFTMTRRHYDHVAPSSRCGTGNPNPPAATSCSCRSAASSARSSRRCATPAACRPTCARCTSRSIRPATHALRDQWAEWGQGVALVVLESPYRSLHGAAARIHRADTARRSRRRT